MSKIRNKPSVRDSTYSMGKNGQLSLIYHENSLYDKEVRNGLLIYWFVSVSRELPMPKN